MNKIEIDKAKVITKLYTNKYDIKSNEKLILNINEYTLSNYEFNLEENSYLEINKFYKNNGNNEEVTINLNGINSKIVYNFSVLSNKSEKYKINVNHNNKNTISIINNHGVVLNDSKLSFIVNSNVYKGNTKSVLEQSSKIIIMGENNSEIYPNLYIDEFDASAHHAASIGKFNKDEIFYLLTKGIDYESAVNLLIKGFLENNLNGGDKFEC